jgi:hypothetical protein
MSGPIGHILEERATIWLAPRYADYTVVPQERSLPRIELAKMAIGMALNSLRAIVETMPDGLVLEGLVAPRLAGPA